MSQRQFPDVMLVVDIMTARACVSWRGPCTHILYIRRKPQTPNPKPPDNCNLSNHSMAAAGAHDEWDDLYNDIQKAKKFLYFAGQSRLLVSFLALYSVRLAKRQMQVAYAVGCKLKVALCTWIRLA